MVNHNQTLEQVAAYRSKELTLTGKGNPERLTGEQVSNGYFQLFGISLQAGRAFAAEEHNAGHANVVIISHRLWRRRFGAEPGLIGQALTLNQQSYTVVGVMPHGFQFSPATDVWLPLTFTAEELGERGDFSLTVIGRLKQGVTIDQAQEQLSAITRRLGPPFPGMAKDVLSVRLEPLHARLVKNVRIISETMARRYWPNADAIGQQINPGFDGSNWFTVVGVVGNVRHFRLEAEARPEMYFPYLQMSGENTARAMSVVIRTTVAPATLANAVRKQVWDLDADQPVTELAPTEEKLAAVMTARRFTKCSRPRRYGAVPRA